MSFYTEGIGNRMHIAGHYPCMHIPVALPVTSKGGRYGGDMLYALLLTLVIPKWL